MTLPLIVCQAGLSNSPDVGQVKVDRFSFALFVPQRVPTSIRQFLQTDPDFRRCFTLPDRFWYD